MIEAGTPAQRLEQYEHKLKEKYKEGNLIRAKYSWAKNRFILEYSLKDYHEKFLKFLYTDALSKEIFDNHVDWINNHPVECEDVQEYWSKYSKEFFQTLVDYRGMGVIDENIGERVLDFAKNINNDPLRYIYEIIQNADDCDYPDGENPSITIELTEQQEIIVDYNEVGMTYADIIALTTIGQSNKRNRKKKRLIGEKGIGFKTIFSVCHSVDIYSGHYAFRLNDSKFVPEYLDEEQQKTTGTGTRLILHLKKNRTDSEGLLNLNEEKVLQELLQKYGFQRMNNGSYELDAQKAFLDCPVLFTNRLRSITLKCGEQTFTITNTNNTDGGALSYQFCKSKIGTIEYYGMTKTVKLSYEQYCSRYPDQYEKTEFEQLSKEEDESITYPIQIIAAKDTKKIEQGCLYSYLPTSTKIKAPINIQLPVKLNLDRSCIYFEGDPDTNRDAQYTGDPNDPKLSQWSEKMLQEMYGLISEFYNDIKTKTDIFLYIPHFQENNHRLFDSSAKYSGHIERLNKYCASVKLFEVFKNIPYFKKYDDSGYCTAGQAVMFDRWVHENFPEEYVAQCNIKDKFLVEYSENATRAKCIGFEEKIPQGKAAVLNGVMVKNPKYRKIILEEAIKEEGKSSYIPENIKDLTIFPARRIDGSVQYLSYTGYTWFAYCEKWGKTRPDSTICFLAEDFPNPIKDINFLKATPECIWENVFSESMEKVKFEDLMDLMYQSGIMSANDNDGTEDWKKAAEQLLREKCYPDFWRTNIDSKIPRIQMLIDYLVKYAPEFAEGE